MSEDLVFKAIADPTRRVILGALAARPAPVHVLAARFAMTRPAVSKHLAVLGAAGLVQSGREGRENVYRLRREPLQGAALWLAGFWSDRLTVLKNLAERKT